ncbi:MAG: OmpH family outer membrane protein [Gammaproteobacteria bacterium]|jgi:outer membrane protein|nr:OmpH family outer membrane protein [Gammaproteobacteria bacterium]
MIRRLTHRTLLVLIAFLLAAPVLASEIGYVDMQRVLEESDLGKAAQANLEERFGDEQQAFAREEAEIRQLQQQLERDRPLMSAEQVEKKETELRERIKQFEEEFTQIQRQLAQAQQQEGNKILQPAREAVISVAKKRKLDAVFEASQSGVVYLDDEGDITDEVIKTMNANTD